MLAFLYKHSSMIATAHRFDNRIGLFQLMHGADDAQVATITRAVQYGRLRAFEELVRAINEGFVVDDMGQQDDDRTGSTT